MPLAHLLLPQIARKTREIEAALGPPQVGYLPTQAKGRYQTALKPGEETAFNAWAKKNKVEITPDYDMRGFWQAQQHGDPRATTANNAGDKQMHFPDTWKTPLHKTFSNESIYARGGEPHWEGDVLVGNDGHVVADERQKAPRVVGHAAALAQQHAPPSLAVKLQAARSENERAGIPPRDRTAETLDRKDATQKGYLQSIGYDYGKLVDPNVQPMEPIDTEILQNYKERRAKHAGTRGNKGGGALELPDEMKQEVAKQEKFAAAPAPGVRVGPTYTMYGDKQTRQYTPYLTQAETVDELGRSTSPLVAPDHTGKLSKVVGLQGDAVHRGEPLKMAVTGAPDTETRQFLARDLDKEGYQPDTFKNASYLGAAQTIADQLAARRERLGDPNAWWNATSTAM